MVVKNISEYELLCYVSSTVVVERIYVHGFLEILLKTSLPECL